MNRSPLPRAAFSVAELMLAMVCVAVVALLLVGVLRQVGQRAREVACVNHLRGLGLAVFGYAADHRMTLPPGNEDGKEWFKLSGLSWLLQYGGGSVEAVAPLLRCPSDPTGPPVTDYRYYYSYTWNAEILMAFVDGAPAHGRQPIPLERVRRKVLFADALTHGEEPKLIVRYPLAVTSKNAPERISSRHRGGANLLFGDGTVARLATREAWNAALYLREE